MGASQSYDAKAMGDEKLVDLPEPEMTRSLEFKSEPDVPLIDMSELDIKSMKKRACSVDPKLAANPRRKAPPINPKTCKEGSVAMGKDGEFYVIKQGKWVKVSKRLEEKKKEQIRERLTEMQKPGKQARKRVAAKKSAKTPKRVAKKSSKKSSKGPGRPKVPQYKKPKAQSPTPKKRGPGRPKGSKNSAKTPKRK